MGGSGRLRQLDRTATFAWSPGAHLPWLAVGTVAGALDASFSTATELEIVDLGLDSGIDNDFIDVGLPGVNGAGRGPVVRTLGHTKAPARFNRLAWSVSAGHNASQEHGIVAGGLENGELGLWNPTAIVKGSGDPLVHRSVAHTGPVRGLDFNPLQSNLLSTGSNDGEIFIWDLTNPTKPYSPATKSTRLEDVTCVAWNRQVAHILASASTNGYTVIWDLRSKRELIQLAHPGGRKGITSISWNPDMPTQIVTASDDDNSPALLLWDLKNARAPEKALYGHTKGVLSVSWCPKDSDLMLSCGKDNQTLLWNPTTAENIGVVDVTNNWAFEVQWCPRNPDLLAIGGFDGTIAVHSLQQHGTGSASEPAVQMSAPSNDPFAFDARTSEQVHAIKLQRPPKWMRRPCGASWSFGGKLVTFRSAKRADGTQAPTVASHTIATERKLAERVAALERTSLDNSPAAFAELCRSLASTHSATRDSTDRDVWNFLSKLFAENPRDEIVRYLGFERNGKGGARSYTFPTGTAGPASVETFDLYPGPILGRKAAAEPVPKDFGDHLTKNLVTGDLESAVDMCLSAHQDMDALLIAVHGGPELLSRTRSAILQRLQGEKTYVRVLDACMEGQIEGLVRNVELGGSKWVNWKDMLALVCTYASEEEFPRVCEILAEKLEKQSANAAATDKQAMGLATLLLYITAGNVAKVLERWTGSSNGPGDMRDALHDRLARMQDLAEKLLVLRQCLDFESALAGGVTVGDSLSSIFLYYAQFAECVANQGNMDEAWRSLGRIPDGAIVDEAQRRMIIYVKDRVYHALTESTRMSAGSPPEAPFAVNDMNLGRLPLEPSPSVWTTAAPTAIQGGAITSWTGEGNFQGTQQPQQLQQQPQSQQLGYQQPMANAATSFGSTQYYGGSVASGYGYAGASVAPPPSHAPYAPPQPQPQIPVAPQPFVPQQPTYGIAQVPPPMQHAYAPAPPPVAGPPPPSTFQPAAPPPARPPLPPPISAAPPQAFNDPPMVPSPQRLLAQTSTARNLPITTPVVPSSIPPPQQQVPPRPSSTNVPPPPATQWMPSNVATSLPQQPASAPAVPPAGTPNTQVHPPISGFAPPSMPSPRPMVPLAAPIVAGQYGAPMGYAPAPPAAAVRAQTAVSTASPSPQPEAVPAKKRLPPGDLSGLPPAQMPIVTSLQKWLQHARSHSGPQNKRVLDDTEKRFSAFFDQLNNKDISDTVVIAKALELTSALDTKQLDAAEKVRVELLTTKFDLTGQWIVGVKRLLDILNQLQAMGQL